MTNLQIINQECSQRGIAEECHTYAGWHEKGYQVQKGEKAIFYTYLWKPVKRKKVDERSENTDAETEHMILVKSYLFSEDQVKEI